MATIGIDVTALTTSASGGIGASQWATMRALARADSGHRFVMYSTRTPVVPFTDKPLYLKWPVRLGSGLAARSNIVWMQTGINRLLKRDAVDLFWSPRHLLPFRARGVATVATIQDFWHLHHPEQQPFANRTLNRLLISRILKRADHIVTTSQATADDAIRHYGISTERITVVPLGVDPTVFRRLGGAEVARVLERYGVPGRYLLALDVHNPRKNFPAVLEAFSRLPEDLRSSLHVIGLGRSRASAQNTSPMALAEQIGIGDRLILPGDAPLGDLVALYCGAEALLYPSVYEGFGMPVLEAMACGCPVITSKTSSLPEVAGGAALLVDPSSAEEIANAITTITRDATLRGQIVQLGGQRAAALSWDATASGMLAVFERVLASRGITGGGAA